MSEERAAAWQQAGAREGFEVAFLERADDGWRVEGNVTAVEEGAAWSWRYLLHVDEAWRTRSLEGEGTVEEGSWRLRLEADGRGRWRRDGRAAPDLEGCLDVDMAATVLTNTLAIRRLGLEVEEGGGARAVWVGTPGLRELEVLEQRYERLAAHTYRYAVPGAGFEAQLRVDDAGLVLEYPDLARRVA